MFKKGIDKKDNNKDCNPAVCGWWVTAGGKYLYFILSALRSQKDDKEESKSPRWWSDTLFKCLVYTWEIVAARAKETLLTCSFQRSGSCV